MQPIISIVGKSDSGKTTLLEELIAELGRRDYKVAVIKHSNHDVEFDAVKKDTWRFSQAGSEVSAISSMHNLAIFKKLKDDISPEELSCIAGWDCDLILTEGYKQSSYPKVEVHRMEQGDDMVSPLEQLIAVVTDEPLEVDVPQFAKTEIKGIADLIENKILAQPEEPDIDLLINGEFVKTKPSFRNLLLRTLLAMVSGTKDDEEITSVGISVRRKS